MNKSRKNVEGTVSDLTALEKKWRASQPSLYDAYSEDGKVHEEGVPENVLDLVPQPTGWRIALLPYRGAATTKGGIMLAKETQERNQLAIQLAAAQGPTRFLESLPRVLCRLR